MTIEAYVPPAAEITNISTSRNCVITTALPHGYSAGIYCTIVIPYPNVMPQINGKTYLMVPISATQLVPLTLAIPSESPTFVGVDTTNMGPFSLGPTVTCYQVQPQTPITYPPQIPPPPVIPPIAIPGVRTQKAQVVPSGEIATTLRNASDVIGPRNPPLP